MITQRDQEIINFINLMGAANTSQIRRVFFRGLSQGRNRAEIRLKELVRQKLLKRDRPFFNMDYVYFKKKGILDHKVTLTEFYCNLLDQPGEILRFDSEVPLDGLQPDAICDYRYKLNVFQFCIEVHLSPVKFNFEKYDNFLNSGKWKEYFKSFPRVVIVTDKNIKVEHDKIKFFIVSTKGTGIEKIFRL